MPIRKAGWKSSRPIGVSAKPIDSPQSELTLPFILTDDRPRRVLAESQRANAGRRG